VKPLPARERELTCSGRVARISGIMQQMPQGQTAVSQARALIESRPQPQPQCIDRRQAWLLLLVGRRKDQTEDGCKPLQHLRQDTIRRLVLRFLSISISPIHRLHLVDLDNSSHTRPRAGQLPCKPVGSGGASRRGDRRDECKASSHVEFKGRQNESGMASTLLFARKGLYVEPPDFSGGWDVGPCQTSLPAAGALIHAFFRRPRRVGVITLQQFPAHRLRPDAPDPWRTGFPHARHAASQTGMTEEQTR
jgi:hypothetical protein